MLISLLLFPRFIVFLTILPRFVVIVLLYTLRWIVHSLRAPSASCWNIDPGPPPVSSGTISLTVGTYPVACFRIVHIVSARDYIEVVYSVSSSTKFRIQRARILPSAASGISFWIILDPQEAVVWKGCVNPITNLHPGLCIA
ncbi:MAG TPA: hypothetical protein DDY29_11840 [Rhodobacteraceae bacterium]|nr:hypothetical protein [Paracoccaceae bacterium]